LNILGCGLGRTTETTNDGTTERRNDGTTERRNDETRILNVDHAEEAG